MSQLNVKTSYEFLSSTILIPQLIEQAKHNQTMALGIVDINMHGAFQFYKACKNANIKPLIGLEVTVQEQKIILYAKNKNGYQELLQISSHVELGTFSPELISNLNHVYIVLVAKSDLRIDEVGISYDYIGFDLTDFDFEMNKAPELYNECLKNNIKMLPIPSVRYIHETDYRYYKALLAIKSNQTLDLAELRGPEYLRNLDELTKLYTGYDSLLTTMNEMISTISIELAYDTYLLPSYPTEYPVMDLLVALSKKGLEKRLTKEKIDKQQEYKERLYHELKIIQDMGFVDYFLIVYDLIRYAKSQDIFVGPGRGSAAGSLVSYCLGITNTDPIEYQLLFERFLNPERLSMPDIDLDFPDDKRDQMIEYAVNKYGKNHVASIVTFGTFQGRSAIRDIAKVMSLPDTHLAELLKYIPQNAKNLAQFGTKDEIKHLRDTYPEIDRVYDYAMKIENIPRHASTHAAGIIITEQDMTNYSAVQPGLLGMHQTQYEAKDLEDIGLLKVDFLGLSNLKIIKRTADLVERTKGIKIPLYDLSFDDPLVFNLLTRKDTDGVFQLESAGIRNALSEIQVDSMEDIVATLALYRPGPMENIKEYSERKRGKAFDYLHEDLKSILEPTYGIIIYQEQIILIAHQFAGYTLAEADLLRRAVSKKQKRLLEAERLTFVEKCQLQGYNSAIAETIYEYILKFANYGFNRSHSVAYAMVAYLSAYLKVHYSIEFFSVLLSHATGSERATEKYIRECKKNHIQVVGPSINQAHTKYIIQNGQIMMPFGSIKNVGGAIAQSIVEERRNGPFKDYLDFVTRTKNLLSQKVVEQLIYASSLDEFQMSKRSMLEQFEEVKKFAEYGSLIDDLEFNYTPLQEYPEQELMKFEKQAFGFNLNYHFLNKYQSRMEMGHLNQLQDLAELDQITVLARLNRKHDIKTKKGDLMAFLTIEDLNQELEVVLFPTEYQSMNQSLKVKEVYLFTVQKSKRSGKDNFIIEKVVKV